MFKSLCTAAALAILAAPSFAQEFRADPDARQDRLVLVSMLHRASPAKPSACVRGDLTIERLSDPDCLALIAVPTPRPDPDGVVAAAHKASAEPQKFEYVEMTDTRGDVRRVRLVGSRFLPPRDENIGLRREATAVTQPLNAIFHTAVAALGFGVKRAIAEELPAQTASADEAVLTASR